MSGYHKISIGSARNAEVGVENLKGFVNRSYRLTNLRIEDSYVGCMMGIALGVHIEQDKISNDETFPAFVEVKYCIIPNSAGRPAHPTWTSIPEEVWLKFFSLFPKDKFADEKFSCRHFLSEMAKGITTLPDGKTPCFKVNLDPFSGKGLTKRLEDSSVVQFMDAWQVKFPTFVKYWDRIWTAKELNDLVSAFDEIGEVSYSVKHNKYGKEKVEVLDKISGYEKLLAQREADQAKLFEEAADAMNELSEKFGIEIDIDEHCCSKPQE